MRTIKYFVLFIVGFLAASFWYAPKIKKEQKEEIQVVVNSIKNLKKLVVASGSFSEIYNYSDSKKYFYDYLSFDKKAIISVNATVEVGYDLSKLEIKIDSLHNKIYILKLPKEEVTISPEIKYFDLQQSQFNTFSKDELNKLHQKSIQKIKETMQLSSLKNEAKERFFEEIKTIYQLSSIFNWQVVDNTNTGLLVNFKD